MKKKRVRIPVVEHVCSARISRFACPGKVIYVNVDTKKQDAKEPEKKAYVRIFGEWKFAPKEKVSIYIENGFAIKYM